jgi:hypothetical protein
MKLLFCFILPSMVPYFLWNETMYWSVLLHVTCLALTYLVGEQCGTYVRKQTLQQVNIYATHLPALIKNY